MSKKVQEKWDELDNARVALWEVAEKGINKQKLMPLWDRAWRDLEEIMWSSFPDLDMDDPLER